MIRASFWASAFNVVYCLILLLLTRKTKEPTNSDNETAPLLNHPSATTIHTHTSIKPLPKALFAIIALCCVSALVIDAVSLFYETQSSYPQPYEILSDTFTLFSFILLYIVFVLHGQQLYQKPAIIFFFLLQILTSPLHYFTFVLGSDVYQIIDILRISLYSVCLFCVLGLFYLYLTRGVTIIGMRQEISSGRSGSFKELFGKMKKLVPFVWPDGWRLQMLVFACFLLLICGRIVNVLVPYQYKVVVNALSESDDRRPYFAWGAILLFVTFRFFQGGVGIISSAQSFLWIPVQQYTTRKISVKMLEHLHNLSLEFHLKRKTGEILRVMDRGTASIGSLLSYLLFNILPVFVDIFIAVLYFILAFGWPLGLVILLTMSIYIIITILVTEWRTKFRRSMIEFDNASSARAVDSLLNFETVKYYNAEDWEVAQYEAAIKRYQNADWKSSASLNVLNTAQNTTITIGLLVGCLICAWRVSVEKSLNVGDFVFFMTYLTQLYQPLNWFGTYYRVIQQNFIDMEKMFELLSQGQSIKDIPGAPAFQLRQGGEISFENVSFAYDERVQSLHDVSFKVPVGKRVAFVGPSGGGKSTIFRLIFRFYDVKCGCVRIDGQDVRSVQQKSLRDHIGVVPQDTVLFNESIRYNIRYGKIDATDEQVEAAAKAAQIHDRIMEFPDGYDTRVGERGMRLSGGEKQRVAIARTLLKSPSIILLDEATSALDNTTERVIQSALHQLKNKTTCIIAHRLSTIVDADVILVLNGGRIVERGTHRELLESGKKATLEEKEKGLGTYYSLWMEQERENQEVKG